SPRTWSTCVKAANEEGLQGRRHLLAVIPLVIHKERPLVEASVYVDNGNCVLRPPLTFMVDTAAQNTFIRPADEQCLRTLREADIFQGLQPLETLMGQIPVKSFLPALGRVGLLFSDINGREVKQDLPEIRFADGKNNLWTRSLRSIFNTFMAGRTVVWPRAGQE